MNGERSIEGRLTVAYASVVALAALLVLFPATCFGGTLTRSGTTVTYTAASNELNNVALTTVPIFGTRLVESGTIAGSGSPISIIDNDPVVGGCYGIANYITCPPGLGITDIVVNAGDGADRVAADNNLDAGISLSIVGGSGSDVLIGGPGDDQIVSRDSEADQINCRGGTDAAQADAAPLDTVTSCESIDTEARLEIVGSTLYFTALAGRVDQVAEAISGSGVLTFTDTAGLPEPISPCARVSAISATCPVAGLTAMEIDLRDGNDEAELRGMFPAGQNATTTLAGGAGNDTLTASPNFDTVEGGPGDDTLTSKTNLSGIGGDTLDGGSGNDLLDDGPATREDTFIGGPGNDTVSYAQSAFVVVSIDDVRNDGEGLDDVRTDVENLVGSPRADHLIGSDKANVIVGGDGTDIVEGRGGNDALTDGLFGIKGGERNTYLGGDGDDILIGSSAADLLEGEAGSDVLVGGGNDDTLLGGPGPNDQLSGGAGSDTQRGGDGSGDAVTDYAGRTEDLTVSLDNVGNDGQTGEADDVGSDVEVVTTGSGNDRLRGGAGDETLDGGAGNDAIEGLSGDDTLGGGPGDDTLDGGAGTDSLSGGADKDSLDGGSGPDSIAGGDGVDTGDYSRRLGAVAASLDGVANDGEAGEGDNVGLDVENLLGGQGSDVLGGSAADNLLDGGEGDDLLDSGTGNDTVEGGTGNDLLRNGVGSTVVSGGDGLDIADYGVRFAPIALSLDGVANDGQAGEADNLLGDVEVLVGGSGPDALIANDDSNTLLGGAGNDQLAAGGGLDVIDAGAGNDAADGGSGSDTIDGGPGNDSLLGGAGDDVVMGSLGNDLLSGGSGLDSLSSGAGADTVLGRDGQADIVSCGPGPGSDSLDLDSIDGVSGDCSSAIEIQQKASIFVSTSRLRANRRGRVKLKLSCDAGVDCKNVRITVKTRSKVRLTVARKSRAKRKRLTLAVRKGVTVPAGTSRTVTLKLRKRGRKLLRRSRRGVRATVTAKPSGGVTSSRRTKLKSAGKRKKGGKR